MSSSNFYTERMTEMERNERFARMRNAAPGMKYNVLVTHNFTPILEEVFGPFIRLMTEGSGLYTYKFYNVFTTLTPDYKRYGFWWNELQRRTDGGVIHFI